MVVKNERVQGILEFVEVFKVCDVTQVTRLYYPQSTHSLKNAQTKMTALVHERALCRKRNDINSKYYYYTGKEPAQVQHKLLLTELYVKLCNRHGKDNVEITTEYTGLPGMRPDAFIKVKNGKYLHMFFVEIQISNNPLDIDKYERAYLSNKQLKVFPNGVFPVVLIATDKKVNVKSKNFEIKVLSTKLNIDKLLETCV